VPTSFWQLPYTPASQTSSVWTGSNEMLRLAAIVGANRRRLTIAVRRQGIENNDLALERRNLPLRA